MGNQDNKQDKIVFSVINEKMCTNKIFTYQC